MDLTVTVELTSLQSGNSYYSECLSLAGHPVCHMHDVRARASWEEGWT